LRAIGEVVPAREGLRQKKIANNVFSFSKIGEVVPAREGLRLFNYNLALSRALIGEVVPAREGLRPRGIALATPRHRIGEVVPAREGLRLDSFFSRGFSFKNRRSGSSKRRIKT